MILITIRKSYLLKLQANAIVYLLYYFHFRWSIMQSTSPTVFVNSSKEGIARVKAGSYAYMMESSMLEFYMGNDCQLTTVGGLLDSKV